MEQCGPCGAATAVFVWQTFASDDRVAARGNSVHKGLGQKDRDWVASGGFPPEAPADPNVRN